MKPEDLKVISIVDGQATLEGHCVLNGETVTLLVSEAGYQAWLAGATISAAFPSLTPPEKEFLNTGIGPTAWQQYFGQADEEDDPFLDKKDDDIAEEDRPKKKPGRKKKPQPNYPSTKPPSISQIRGTAVEDESEEFDEEDESFDDTEIEGELDDDFLSELEIEGEDDEGEDNDFEDEEDEEDEEDDDEN